MEKFLEKSVEKFPEKYMERFQKQFQEEPIEKLFRNPCRIYGVTSWRNPGGFWVKSLEKNPGEILA